jgi:hypothetical protein
MVGQFGTGACLEPATLYLNVIETRGESRNNHYWPESFITLGIASSV